MADREVRVARKIGGACTIVLGVGYEGRTIEEFIEWFRRRMVNQVLDVRAHAWSRKVGFSADELRERLAHEGIAYVQLPELGCTRDIRRRLRRAEEPSRVLEEYRQALDERPDTWRHLEESLGPRRTALMCTEKNPNRCHRSVLLTRLGTEGYSVAEG